jgi:GH43 family beta-xylosidase
MTRATLLLTLLVAALCAGETFTNPFVPRGADPWVVRHQGAYYHCLSEGDRVKVRRTTALHELARAEAVTVWAPPPGQPYSKEVWAPEMHVLDGKWWIYVAADDGRNENHRMWVLEGGTDPQQPFTLKGRMAPATDRWAIDGTVLTLGQRRFFIWSGWEGHENIAQHLYIAEMANPWTLKDERVRISSPTLAWELNGKPLINEGPQVLQKNGRTFIIYSASGSWTDDYCLGQLALTGTDPMKPASWTKKPAAVFSRTPTVFGPGHGSFTVSPSGREDWIIYHAARKKGSGWDRDLRMQPFRWNADGSPDFGTPIDPGVALPIPR